MAAWSYTCIVVDALTGERVPRIGGWWVVLWRLSLWYGAWVVGLLLPWLLVENGLGRSKGLAIGRLRRVSGLWSIHTRGRVGSSSRT